MAMSEWMAKIPQSEVKSRYGLESYEWTGSLSDRVMTIINKNDPAREDRVNALLYDSADFFKRSVRTPLAPGEEFTDDVEFRDAVSRVVENGVSINDETYLFINDVDNEYVVHIGEESLLSSCHEVYFNKPLQIYYRQSLREQYQRPSDEYIKMVYGLEPGEWTGSWAADVRTIINKDAPNKELQVNCFLRDQVAVFDTGMERQAAEDASFSAMKVQGFAYSYALRDAINEASWSGILINPETMNAIKQVERDYVIPYGGESLTRQYDKLRELNDARKYYRETVPSLASSSDKKPEPTVETQVEGKEPVHISDVLSGWMASMGRGTDGKPLASSPASQGSQRGSIGAVLPGSSVSTSTSRPRVSPKTPSVRLVQPQTSSFEIDDDFEL